MKEKETSTANKALGAASMGATGLGVSQILQSTAEQNSDQRAESDMAAYLETFRCDFGNGQNIRGGQTAIVLPAGNALMQLYNEYKTLAQDLKSAKETLGMSPGIESETIFDKANTGLYDNVSIGKTDGAFTSLSRALADPTGTDATEWDDQKSDTSKTLKTGMITTGAGIVGGIAGNMLINKDAPQESSDKIKQKYEAESKKMDKDLEAKKAQLEKLLADNEKKINEYNDLITAHQAFILNIIDEDCIEQFAEYIAYIKTLTPIENKMQDPTDLEFAYDLEEQKRLYTMCVDAALEKARLAKAEEDCWVNPGMQWVDEKCIPVPVVARPTANDETTTEVVAVPVVAAETETSDETIIAAAVIDENACPAENPRFKSLNESSRVGDFCSGGNIASGKVIKYAAGTKRSGKDVGGTCSCSATGCTNGKKPVSGICCTTGFHVIGGRCVEETADANYNGIVYRGVYAIDNTRRKH